MLLIDDAPFFRNMLAPVLKARRLCGARQPRRAKEALALIDDGASASTSSSPIIEMPGMDGFELAVSGARAIRARRDPPIIGLSSLVSPEAIERGRKVGLLRLRRQVRPPGSDRGAQGADRRHRSCGMSDAMSTTVTDNVIEYVTATIGGQLFGLPISRRAGRVHARAADARAAGRARDSPACSICAAAS